MQTTSHRYGSLARGGVEPRPGTSSRNDHIHLFSSPANAARLRKAIDRSVAGTGFLTFTMEELRKELGLEET